MKLHATSAALSLCLVASTLPQIQGQTAGQTAAFTDPANLRGERVSPRTGRELPIDRPEAQGGRGLEQMLRKLNTRASLMLIVAHPDDEDGGMLTLYSRGLGARVADLSLTRGEGGQNAMTGDFEDALGLIRTQELLSSDRYTGVDQFFGTEVDFGFSKTKEEAFSKWTHERVLYDAVRAVRLYRPLVIAAVFIGGVTDGHGQHQVSGEIAQEVFKAAADPRVFPELTAEGILPWAPLKVYARVPMQAITAQGLFDYATDQYTPARFTNYVTGEVTTTPPTVDVTVHEGQTDPLLTNSAANPGDLRDRSADPNAPLSYVQFARIGLGLQKTQIGPGVRLAAPGVFDIGYHRYGSRLKKQPEHEQSFFDGIDTSIQGIAGLTANPPDTLLQELDSLASTIRTATQQQQTAPKQVAATLAMALRSVNQLLTALPTLHLPTIEAANIAHELRIKQVQLNDALLLALGLDIEATAPESDAVVRSELTVHTRLTAASSANVVRLSSELRAPDGVMHQGTNLDWQQEAALNGEWLSSIRVSSAMTQTQTMPYFFRTDIEQPTYELRNPSLREAPATPSPLTFWTRLGYAGVDLEIGRVFDAQDQDVDFVPPISVAFSHPASLIPLDQKDPVVWVESRIPISACTAYTRDVTPAECEHFADESQIRLELPLGWRADKPNEALVPKGSTVTQFVGFTLAPPVPRGNENVSITAVAHWKGENYGEGYRGVGYPGLARTNLYLRAVHRAVAADLHDPLHLRIGYLEGTGDQVFDSLFSLYGSRVQHISVADLTPAHLAQFDTVVLGVRTYNAHPDLHGAPTQALLDFARNGGNVIVQYQTPEFTAADAPYPLSLGAAEKVVDETAPVKLLDPAAAVFSAPNHITSADFNGWIEERGHDFMATWDPHYTALTETHDPGQSPQDGGLLTTQLGRGHWTYCAFALYRQLPEAVPGAFRVFVNLLGLPDAPAK